MKMAMWMPDLPTLYATLILTDLVLTLILYLYGKNYRTYAGYRTWIVSLLVYCCSLTLITFRADLPIVLGIVIANVLFVLAYLMRADSIQEFVRKKPLDRRLYPGVLAITLIVIAFFTYSTNSIALRAVCISIALLVLSVLACYPLVTSPEKETRAIRSALALIIGAVAILYVVRLFTLVPPGANPVTGAEIFPSVYYYALILTDITATGLFILLNMARFQAELERSERQAKESEEKYRGVVTGANEGIVMVQNDIVRFMNPKALAACGGDEGYCIGRPFLSLIHPDQRKTVDDLHRRRVAGERVPATYETAFVSRDGEPVEIEINTRFLVLDGVPTDLVFIRDIRDRKQAQKALEQAMKKLSLLNHVTFEEIRNDIFALSGYQTLVAEGISRPGPSLKPLIEKELIITRKISGALNFAEAYRDLGQKPAKWQGVTNAFLMAFSHRDTLNMQHAVATGDLEVFADPLLERVFQILVDNVFRHGKTATVITLRYRQDPGGTLAVFFEDDGAGIPKDLKEKIFHPDFQKTRSAGLFLAREILDITGITIRETGDSGKGARFEIRVPKGAYRFPPAGS